MWTSLAVLAAVHASCRSTADPNEQSIKAYFEAIDTNPLIVKAFRDIGLELARDRTSPSTPARIAAYSHYFKQAAPLMGELARDLEAVTPPSAFREQHEDLIALAREFQRTMDSTAKLLQDTNSWSDAQRIASVQIVPLLSRLGELCTQIKNLAAASDVDTSWGCLELPIAPSLAAISSAAHAG